MRSAMSAPQRAAILAESRGVAFYSAKPALRHPGPKRVRIPSFHAGLFANGFARRPEIVKPGARFINSSDGSRQALPARSNRPP